MQQPITSLLAYQSFTNHSTDYGRIITTLQRLNGYGTIKTIAAALNVLDGVISRRTKKMKDKGLIVYSDYVMENKGKVTTKSRVITLPDVDLAKAVDTRLIFYPERKGVA